MNHLGRDIRYGMRMLIKHPTLTITAILTFGLGIGISTMVFSIVNGAFFKGLPFEDSEKIVALANTNPSRNLRNVPVSVHDFSIWQQRQTVFETMGAWSMEAVNLVSSGAQPERVAAGQMTAGAFDTLRVKPILGRTFNAREDRPGARPVIVLSYDIWRDRYESSRDILGQTVRTNGIPRTIIGIMPKGFAFPDNQKVWIPLEIDPLATPRGQGASYAVIARLKEGVSIQEANAQAAAMGAQLAKEFPDTNRDLRAVVRPFVENVLGTSLYGVLYTMLAAGIGVLLVACVNVANLLLARVSLRSREIAVRMAIGAKRAQVVRQFMTEVLLLAAGGSALGLGLCQAGMQWFQNAITVDPPPFFITFGLDYRVMVFVAAMTFAASLFAGLFPAFRATRMGIGEALKDASRASIGLRSGRFSAGLIVVEVAVSCGLLITAGLMTKSIVQLKTFDLPFATDSIFTARLNLPRVQYPDDASRTRFLEELLSRAETIPAVEAAALSDEVPGHSLGTTQFQIEGQAYGRASDYPIARRCTVSSGYFKTFGVGILRGRGFEAVDRANGQPVAVINESFARKYFPKRDPLGQRIKTGRADSSTPWLTIVGLVPDMLMQGLGRDEQTGAGYYIPIAQQSRESVGLALKTRGEPGAVTPELRAAVASLDRDLPIYDARSMKEVIARESWFVGVFGSFFLAFGASALLLAVTGLYGVMSFSVMQRTREFGIRMALGAQGGQLLGLIMKKGVFRLALGLFLGLGLGLLAGGFLRTLLFRVSPRDPLVLVTILAVLALAGLLANLIPARRATRINPVIALSSE
ncbi:MAG: ABC transporter permease [Acidobacteriia bacterium]|nr:ABC transporter permease [Terriglobia bacterium]